MAKELSETDKFIVEAAGLTEAEIEAIQRGLPQELAEESATPEDVAKFFLENLDFLRVLFQAMDKFGFFFVQAGMMEEALLVASAIMKMELLAASLEVSLQ